MDPSGPRPAPRPGLSAEEFSTRFQAGARVLWTLAAGLLGDPAEAEDVCQEAFLAAYARRADFEPGTDFLAWMGRFVRNVSANELRKRARRRTVRTDPVLLDQDEALGASPEAGPSLQQLDERLLAGLRELGEVPRACFLLRTLRELSHAEIAALLSIPEGTAMSHFHRARLFLRARLDPAFHGAQP
ncbi:MAG TPA: RNA polymerase sigma factor [Planctomycetota bacterium]